MAVVVDSEEEFREILESSDSKLIIADFWAEWCGPCRQMMPVFTKMAKDPEFKDVIFLKVDVDELSELSEEYQISCMPTFIFFKNNEKLDEVSGANKDKLLEIIRKYNP